MNQIKFYKKSDSNSSVGMSVRAVLKMSMLFAIIAASLGIMNPVEVKSQCPPRDTADCEDYNYGGMVTLEHPAGSGCFLNFSYCYRNNCDGELEVFIYGLQFIATPVVIGQPDPCPTPPVNSDLYMECLDAVINTLLPFIYGPVIPPCSLGTTFRVHLKHYSCQTVWYPHFISCEYALEYNKERCDIDGDGVCLLTVEYCWEDDHPVYTLKSKLVKTEFYGNVDCKRKNFLFIDYVWVSQSCLGLHAEQKKHMFLDMFRNTLPCQGLTGRAFEDCVTAVCAADPSYFYLFLQQLYNTLTQFEGCCDLNIYLMYMNLLLERFPDGNISCEPTCD